MGRKRTKIFQFVDDGTSPVFQNTMVVVLTYICIFVFYAKQLVDLKIECWDGGTWAQAVNMLVDAVGVSTITYLLTVAFQSLPAASGTNAVSQNMWLLVFGFVYALLYGVFTPRHIVLNVVLCVFTLSLIFYAGRCVANSWERGQADDNTMEGGKVI